MTLTLYDNKSRQEKEEKNFCPHLLQFFSIEKINEIVKVKCWLNVIAIYLDLGELL